MGLSSKRVEGQSSPAPSSANPSSLWGPSLNHVDNKRGGGSAKKPHQYIRLTNKNDHIGGRGGQEISNF